MHIRVVAFLALAFVASAMPAQTPRLYRGARVRVTFPSDSGQSARHVIGKLERLADDTVVITEGYLPSQAISLGGGAQLEIDRSEGHGRLGAIIGAVLGFVVADGVWQSCGRCRGDVPPLMLAVPGVGLGALVGAAVGSALRTASWVPVKTAGVRIVTNP
jgi:hypothetical protein